MWFGVSVYVYVRETEGKWRYNEQVLKKKNAYQQGGLYQTRLIEREARN